MSQFSSLPLEHDPLEPYRLQTGHPLRRDPRVRVAAVQLLLALPLGVDPPAELRVSRVAPRRAKRRTVLIMMMMAVDRMDLVLAQWFAS